MKINRRNTRKNRGSALLLSLMLVCALAIGGILAVGGVPALRSATAETVTAPAPAPVADASPAIYVAEKNAASVVGIITGQQNWNDNSRSMDEAQIAQGSGVVIAEGGYVLTNYHVIEDGNAFQVLMPGGDKVEASLVGSDSSLDLAVLKVEEQADTLVPVSIGSSNDLPVGSTVIAIGNPGGEVLANTVTQGIISALERSSVNGSNTTRNVNYIQHDAAINSGNSGGGLFDYLGNLIGINTLKYSGSYYSSTSYEGLGFAIPVETAYPIAQQLIEHGKVIRPQMGVVVTNYNGPDEPASNRGPLSVCVDSVREGSPAEKAGMKQYDFIYAINGERVTNLRELTTLLDQFQAGDTVTVTVVRYNNVGIASNNSGNGYGGYYNNPFGFGFGFGYPFGGFGGYGNDDSDYYGGYNSGSGSLTVGGGYETIDLQVTLEVLD